MDNAGLDRLTDCAERLWRVHGAQLPIEGLTLARRTTPSGPFHGVYKPSLCVVLRGAKVSRLGSQAFRYDAGKCLIASLDVPIRAEVVEASPTAPYLAFALNLDTTLVAEMLIGARGGDAGEGPTLPALAVHEMDEALIDPLARLLALAETPGDIPVLAPMLHREIVWRLLNGPQGAALRQVGLAGNRLSQIGQAIGWIRQNFTQTLSVAHLAALAGMSAATFHRHFKAATGMTPVQYQKSLRLQEARRLLLSEGRDVARIGFAIGYDSPSQFSREYRRMFGAPPGRDLAQMRREVAMVPSR
ncbi:MAG: AraC family transcriptional regulator [Thioclava sp.]|nr:AraC family transcriptional regulator [Thioclava sp.]MBD3803402.1 AraC family transcriptional regulator [Thioclava sp.]